jgi:hypothetical protein
MNVRKMRALPLARKSVGDTDGRAGSPAVRMNSVVARAMFSPCFSFRP